MKEKFIEIIAEIERELQNLQEFHSELAKIKSEKDIIFKRSMGSILHDFYNCCERVFKKIAIEINAGYEDTPKWHKTSFLK